MIGKMFKDLSGIGTRSRCENGDTMLFGLRKSTQNPLNIILEKGKLPEGYADKQDRKGPNNADNEYIKNDRSKTGFNCKS